MKPLRVIKVGGSLFNLEDLTSRLNDWLISQSPGSNILIAGGGAWVDAIRKASIIHNLTEEDSHWLSIRAMSFTARLLNVLVPEAELTENLDEVKCNTTCPLWVIDAEAFLRQEEVKSHKTLIPHSWDATSDSIAAKIAVALDAQELVLLKSKSISSGDDYLQAAERGYVDPFFPLIAEKLPKIRFVNLRDS